MRSIFEGGKRNRPAGSKFVQLLCVKKGRVVEKLDFDGRHGIVQVKEKRERPRQEEIGKVDMNTEG